MRKGLRPTEVKHWREKKIVLLELWHLATQFEITERLYPENPDLAERVNDNLDNWETHFPVRKDGPGKPFFRDLVAALGAAEGTTANQLMLCPIDEFIAFLPDARDQRRAWERLRRESDLGAIELHEEVFQMIERALAPESTLPELVLPEVEGEASAGLKAIFHEMMVRKRGFLQSVRQGARLGRLDQRHFYLTPDAADAWLALVRAEAYPSYDHCKSGLKKLVESEIWRSTIANCGPNTVVMLAGGGAPTKDLVLIHSLLRDPGLNGSRIPYYLIDISPYMLWSSYWWLYDSLAEIEGGDRVDVKPVVDDVLELKELTSEHFRRDGTILFGITGGTIGNLEEGAFFQALNRVSREGDLLIVSADTIPVAPDSELSSVEEGLIHKYDHPDLRRFIGPAVRSLAAELELMQPVASIFDAVTLELDDQQRFSDVPKSLSVTMHMKKEDRRVNMLSSTRYRRRELADFARSRRWRLLAEFESPLNPNFVQFFFQRFE